jgi:acyl-CoA thioesterase I
MPGFWSGLQFAKTSRPGLSLAASAACLLATGSLGGCERDAEPRRSPPASAAPSPAVATTTDTESATATVATPPEAAADLPKVAFLGDSISAGLHLPADQAFPALLARRLRAQRQAFELINAGVSGDTTAGGLRRVDWLLKQQPDVVVVELGANDGLRGVPLAAIEHNLRGILEKVRAAGATPLLLAMRLPPSYGREYVAGFEAIYPRVARELDLAVVPFFMKGVAGVAELNLEDGLHPTAEGHERLADNVEPALREALTRATQAQPR